MFIFIKFLLNFMRSRARVYVYVDVCAHTYVYKQ